MSAKGEHPVSQSPRAVVCDWISCPAPGTPLIDTIDPIPEQISLSSLCYLLICCQIPLLFSLYLLAFSFSISPSFVVIVESQSRVQLFCDPMDRSPPGFSVHGILQARILQWVAISSSQEIFSTQGRNLHLLHWQVNYLPLSHQGSPGTPFYLPGGMVLGSCSVQVRRSVVSDTATP